MNDIIEFAERLYRKERQEEFSALRPIDQQNYINRIDAFFDLVAITEMKTAQQGESEMDATEALKHIRTLIRPADDIDDAEALRRLIREVRAVVDRALSSQ